MRYRKFRADYLWDGRQWAERDRVLITTADGMVQGLVPVSEAGEGIEVYRGALCPGFVNCHCHLELSHLRGTIPGGTGLVDFLLNVMHRRSQGDAELVAEAIESAEAEMLAGGIVAVGDICNTADTLRRKTEGRLTYYNFIETMGFIEGSAPDRFASAVGIYEPFEKLFPGRNSVVPHAPYSVSPTLFRLIATFAAGRPLTMHSQEAVAENEFYLSGGGEFLRLYKALGLDVTSFGGTGKRSPESVLGYFPALQPMILVHNIDLSEEDLDQMSGRQHLFFCLCPNANLYIGGLLPDVGMMAGRGCRIVIGTDSLASNRGLSVLDELRTLQAAIPALETGLLLGWATAGGAEALGLGGNLGSFSPGFRPGILLLQGLDGERLTAATTVRRLL